MMFERYHIERKELEMELNYLLSICFTMIGIIIATTMHEFTRAAVSTYFGDTMPKDKKRLTLNPLRHFEPVGFILMIVTGGFGWGQPVETSALYYKNRKRDTLITAIAPSVVNLILGFIFLLLQKMVGYENIILSSIFFAITQYNVALAVFNLVPVVPMDCVKVLSVVMPSNKYFQYLQYEKIIQVAFLLLLFMGLFGNFFFIIVSLILNLFDMMLFFV